MSPAKPERKGGYGGCAVDHFGPSPEERKDWPEAINVVISFEEALKLHLSLGQLLAELNSFDRSKKSGKLSAANLCVFKKGRITVNLAKLKA